MNLIPRRRRRMWAELGCGGGYEGCGIVVYDQEWEWLGIDITRSRTSVPCDFVDDAVVRQRHGPVEPPYPFPEPHSHPAHKIKMQRILIFDFQEWVPLPVYKRDDKWVTAYRAFDPPREIKEYQDA